MNRQSVNPTDLLTGSLTILLGLAALSLVPDHVDSAGFAAIGDMSSPAFFPLIASGLLTLLSGLLILRAVSGKLAANTGPAESQMAQPPVERPLRVTLCAGLLVLATGAIFWLGFLLTAGGLIAGLAAILGYRRYWLVLFLAVSVPVGIYVLFEQLLSVLLPRGIF